MSNRQTFRSARFLVRVGAQPVHVRVKAGSDGIRGLGTLLLALGATSALAGLVVELSYSQSPNGIAKSRSHCRFLRSAELGWPRRTYVLSSGRHVIRAGRTRAQSTRHVFRGEVGLVATRAWLSWRLFRLLTMI